MDKFTPQDLQQAVEDLSMLEYFPREPGAQAAIMRLLVQMVPHRKALRWLVDTFTNRIGKWHGPTELRAILCTRFAPRDGIESWSQIAGFSAEDGLARSLEAHKQLKADGTLPPSDEPLVKRLEAAKKRGGGMQRAGEVLR